MSAAADALRYLGIRAPDAQWLARAEEMLALLREKCPPKFRWKLFPLERAEGGVALAGGFTACGGMAEKMLADCHHAAVLVCTLGAGLDRLLATEQARDMARAALMDACASALVEEGCDAAEVEIRAHLPGKYLTDRFSPGYGDLPLSLQPALLAATDAARRLGVQAAASYLLSPMKSVTAILGVADEPQPSRVRGCAYCALRGKCGYQKPCG